MLRADRSRCSPSLVLVVVVVAAAVGGAAPEARACGPDFPNQLLRDRRATMLGLVDGSFDWDAARLVPAPAVPFVVREGDEPDGVRSTGGSVERALYDDAATHFRAGDLVRAEAGWRRLLALPRAERIHRSTWAAFMLGRATGDAAWFRQTRALAREGFHDALGLAVASLGEEARRALDDGEIAKAARLYAEQAAHGSEIGRTSLLFVARRLVNDETALAKAARNPLVRKLVSSYLYARSDELGELDGAWDPQHLAKIERLVAMLERHHSRDDGADRLAAVAYRAGQWKIAARLAALSDAPLSTWVQGKLALREGRLDDARALLAKASAAFPPDADWGTRSVPMDGSHEVIAPRARVDAERAVLALEARDYTTALTHLLQPDDRYGSDAAYIAERVLSLDELVRFMEANNAPRLRALLARRLVRAGRVDDALAWFDDPARREAARSYGALLVRGRDTTADRFDRARALWMASNVARANGMEILGFELDPDWAIYEGGFDLGAWDEQPRADTLAPGPAFSSYDEQLRVASTVAVPLARFHYRLVAADLAAEAAQLLPPRSQAYAASLCHAARYVIDQQPELARLYWQRYVDHGAAVDFAGTFGRACPAPDFVSAAVRYDDHDQPRAPIARDIALLCAITLAVHALARAVAGLHARAGATRPR